MLDQDGLNGFERKDIYTYNNFGQIIRIDRDILGVGEEIDSYITYVNDLSGNHVETKTYTDSLGNIETHNTREYDAYGRTSKEVIYNPTGEVIRVNYFKYDERGFVSEMRRDMNNNGQFDENDTITVTSRRSDGQVIYQIQSEYGKADRKILYSYDEFDRISGVHYDTNLNDKIDDNEINTKQYFIGSSPYTNIVENYTGSELTSLRKLHYSDNNITLGNIYADKERVYHTITYNGSGSTPRSSIEDYTDSRFDTLFDEVGGSIKTINLSNANASTQITLDNNVLAKLSSQVKPTTVAGDTRESLVLTINGDATDSVILKDYGEFSKAEGTVQVGRNHYDKLTTEVEGKNYTLLVDTDIQLFDAANLGMEII